MSRKQRNPIVNIDQFHWGKVLADTNEAYEHEVMKRIEGLMQVQVDPQTAEGSLYGDGVRSISNSSITGMNLTVEANSIPQEDLAVMLGRAYDEVEKEMIVSANDIQADIVIGFRATQTDGTFLYFKFYVGKAQLQSETYNQRTESTEYQTRNLVIECNPRSIDTNLQIIKESDVSVEEFFGAEVLPVVE